MGAVYRAVQKSLDRTVAIKILPQEFSKDAAFCAGFEAEAKAMARLNHPNLIGGRHRRQVEEEHEQAPVTILDLPRRSRRDALCLPLRRCWTTRWAMSSA